VKEHYCRIRDQGGEVVVVSFTAPELVRLHVETNRPPFPIVSDPTRACYQEFGLERMPWTGMLRLGLWGRYLRLVARGWMPRLAHKGDDLLQLGGDFVLDARRRIVLAFRSREPTDRPSAQQLVDGVGRARGVDVPAAP
jgi:hypothetical protein